MEILGHILGLFFEEVPMGHFFLRLLLLHVSLTRKALDGVFASTLEAVHFLVKRLDV